MDNLRWTDILIRPGANLECLTNWIHAIHVNACLGPCNLFGAKQNFPMKKADVRGEYL